MGNCCAGESGDDVVAEQKTKLDPIRVNNLWHQVRGDAGKETTAKIDGIWQNNDKNSDNKIDTKEGEKLCKAFLLKSDSTLTQADLNEEMISSVFNLLDTNDDGVLDRDELETAMLAMWLMVKDNCKLEDFI